MSDKTPGLTAHTTDEPLGSILCKECGAFNWVMPLELAPFGESGTGPTAHTTDELREDLANHLRYVHPLPWRVGRKVARNVYDAGNEGVAMFTHAHTAAIVVLAVNRLKGTAVVPASGVAGGVESAVVPATEPGTGPTGPDALSGQAAADAFTVPWGATNDQMQVIRALRARARAEGKAEGRREERARCIEKTLVLRAFLPDSEKRWADSLVEAIESRPLIPAAPEENR